MKLNGTVNKKLMKKMNTNAILNTIRVHGSISRADIAKKLKLNPATVSSNVNDLLKKGLIIETGSGKSSGGRRPILLKINSDNFLVLGVHTEISGINIGIVNVNGKVMVKRKFYFKDHGAKEIYDCLVKGIYSMLNTYSQYKSYIIGIGIGLHGLVNSEKGVSIFAPAYNWHNLRVAEMIQKEFEIPTYVDNDVRAMALGEKWLGKEQTLHNFMLINIGEGVGGAIITNNVLYNGASFGAGEIGHIKVTQKAMKCECGNYGCLTTVANKKGIVNRLIESNNKHHKESTINFYELDLKNVIDMGKNGDEIASRVLNQTGVYIGRAIGTVINLLNPERILLTGELLDYGESMMKSIIETAQKESIGDNYTRTKISKATIRKDLGIIGAATIIVNDIFSI